MKEDRGNDVFLYIQVYVVLNGHTRQIQVLNTADPQIYTINDLQIGHDYNVSVREII